MPLAAKSLSIKNTMARPAQTSAIPKVTRGAPGVSSIKKLPKMQPTDEAPKATVTA